MTWNIGSRRLAHFSRVHDSINLVMDVAQVLVMLAIVMMMHLLCVIELEHAVGVALD